LSSPSRWNPNSLLPMQKIQMEMDSSHQRCQIFTSPRGTCSRARCNNSCLLWNAWSAWRDGHDEMTSRWTTLWRDETNCRNQIEPDTELFGEKMVQRFKPTANFSALLERPVFACQIVQTTTS
jgi:hypothetical protein